MNAKIRTSEAGKRLNGGKGNNPDCHIGLSLLGSTSSYSGNLTSEVAKTALLNPSLEASRQLLNSGISGLMSKPSGRYARIWEIME